MTQAQPTICVIDDDSSFRSSVARLLKASGYQVALYESGEHFLQQGKDDFPGCILLDLQLPGLAEGLALLPELAAWPVVSMLSATEYDPCRSAGLPACVTASNSSPPGFSER